MRQIKIIGLVLLLFVGVFPYQDHQTGSGNLFFIATSHHTSPLPNSSGTYSGIQLPNSNKMGCETLETILPAMTSATIQTNSITNLIRDKTNKVSFPYFPKAVTVVVSLLLLLLFFYKRRVTRYSHYFAGLFLLVAFAGNVNAQSSQTFNASGTFTVPAGVTSIKFECWGVGSIRKALNTFSVFNALFTIKLLYPFAQYSPEHFIYCYSTKQANNKWYNHQPEAVVVKSCEL